VATRGNYLTIVEKLLEKSPNINTVDKDGMTALFIACKEGYQGSILQSSISPEIFSDLFSPSNFVQISTKNNLYVFI
jgi:ankyrin repeat-rich membrane spanning protein